MGATSPKIIGNFEILAKLGQGGMGAVFKARQISLDRTVALKILPPSIAKNGKFIERFQREARASAKLNHPNIVQGIDVGFDEAAGLWYFAMEFVEGPTVKKVLDEQKVLDEKRALEIVRDITQALVCAEKNGIVHRDIKPDNILLNNRGEAKLADLGLAKQTQDDASVTQTGMAVGTPYYMAPEQARGDTNAIDFRTDLYALGATLFHLVTGEPLFSGNTGAVIMTKHITEKPRLAHRVNLNVSEATGRLINRLVQKEPAKRFQSAGELMAAIDKILSQGVTTGPRAPVGSGSGRQAAIRGGTTGRLPPVRGMPTAHRPSSDGGTKGTPVALYAGLGGALLLVVVLFLFLGGSSSSNPNRTAQRSVPNPPAVPENPVDQAAASTPVKPPPDLPAKAPPPPAVNNPSLAHAAFDALNAALAGKALDDKAGRRALLDAFLKDHGSSVEGARARVMLAALDKPEGAPPDGEDEVANANAPVERGTGAALRWAGREYKVKGNWKEKFGAEGYSLAAFSAATKGEQKFGETDLQSLPAYVAEFKKAGGRSYVWSPAADDPVALAAPDGKGRRHTQDFHPTQFEYTLRFNDRKVHRVSVYLGPGNPDDDSMKADVVEAATGKVLNSQLVMSFGRKNGIYLSWDVLGDVILRFEKVRGANVSCAAVFFDPTPEKVAAQLVESAVAAENAPASQLSAAAQDGIFVKKDTQTNGDWKGAYGKDGYHLPGMRSDNSGPVKSYEFDAQALPAYVASFKKSHIATYQYSVNEKSRFALVSPVDGARRCALDYSKDAFEYEIRFKDRQPHRVAVYLQLGWVGNDSMRVEVIDADSGKELDRREVNKAERLAGVYLAWTMSGAVKLRFVNTKGPYAMCSGVFFDPAPQGAVPAAEGKAPAVESQSPAAVAGEAAYAAFLDPFLSALRDWDRAAAAQLLAKANTDPKLNPYRDRLAADRKTLAWMEQIEGAVAKGAETLKDVDSFTLYTTDDKPTKVGRKETSKLSAVEDGKLQIDIGGGEAPLSFKVLTLRTKRELAQRGLGNDAAGKVLAAWLAMLSLGGENGAPDAAQVKAAIDAVAQAGASKEDVTYLTERFGAMERSAKEVAADRAWGEIAKLAEKGKEQWKPLLQALKDFEAAHAGTAAAQAHEQEVAGLRAESQRMIDLLEGYFFDFKTKENFEAFKRLFSEQTPYNAELQWRDNKLVFHRTDLNANSASGAIHLQAKDLKLGRYWDMHYTWEPLCRAETLTPGRRSFMVRFMEDGERPSPSFNAHHRFHLEWIGSYGGFLCCAIRAPNQCDNGEAGHGYGLFTGTPPRDFGPCGGSYLERPRPPSQADGRFEVVLQMRARHLKVVANGQTVTDVDLPEAAAEMLSKSPLAIYSYNNGNNPDLYLERFFFKARTPDEAQAKDAQPEAPRETPAPSVQQPEAVAAPGLPPPEKRIPIAVLGSSEQSTRWGPLKGAFSEVEIGQFDHWTKENGGGVVSSTSSEYANLTLKGKGGEVKAGTVIGFEVFNGTKETFRLRPRVSLTKAGRLGNEVATEKDYIETNKAELNPGESGIFYCTVPERDAGMRTVLSIAFAIGAPYPQAKGVQLKIIWYTLPEVAAKDLAPAEGKPADEKQPEPAAGQAAGQYAAEWTKLDIKNAKPSGQPYAGACMTYDSKRQRFVYLGASGDKNLNDLWTFDPKTSAWAELKRIEGGNEELKNVNGRYNRLIYDPCTDMYWLSNGMAFNPSTDAWDNMAEKIGKDVPWPRIRGPWALDPVNGRFLSAYWTGDANAPCKPWFIHSRSLKHEDLPDANVPFRYYMDGGIAYDSKSRVFVLFGGNALKTPLDDTWVFDPQRRIWTELPVKQRPPPRSYYNLVYYEAIETIVLFGGAAENDLWVLDSAAQQWVKADLKGEINHHHLAGAYSPDHKLVLGQTSHGETCILRVVKR
ncbi:MAG: protein kinase [Planctomycetes bacterium]|nr:protein kinase [Planctomycetota bacterium]